MALINRQIHLVRRPRGEPTADCFALVEQPLGAPGPGQVLVRNEVLSLDPYMRGRMDDAKSYAQPQPLDAVMIGATAGEVLESNDPAFRPGDKFAAKFGLGWQTHAIVDARAIVKVDAARVPLSYYVGLLGMPGATAWYGTMKILEPAAGQTVAVTAATGAVGSIVGQLAKAHGARVVGIAGGAAKCDYAVRELGFDACVDYKAAGWKDALGAAAPGGIDRVFENVGGEIFDTLLARMNPFGRIAVCGLISGYNGTPMPIQNFRSVLVNKLRIQGFIISDHLELWPQAHRELADLVLAGRLKYRESAAEGLENAPAAFLAMLKGGNFGKQIVRL
ncbi:MAG: NADP-dependent oxidoreductase [Burkholderiales bacterium]|nr:NADP-dependent oxidoreductase [Burkholderiales bacterium]